MSYPAILLYLSGLIPPQSASSVTTCEEIASAPDSSSSLTAAEAITLPNPADCRSLTKCANLSRTNPANVACLTIVSSPPTYAGLFLMF